MHFTEIFHTFFKINKYIHLTAIKTSLYLKINSANHWRQTALALALSLLVQTQWGCYSCVWIYKLLLVLHKQNRSICMLKLMWITGRKIQSVFFFFFLPQIGFEFPVHLIKLYKSHLVVHVCAGIWDFHASISLVAGHVVYD